MIIIKLGGSIVTNKREPMTFKDDVANDLISEIQNADKKIITIHGAGSFAHPIARKYQLFDGFRDPQQLEGIAQCQNAMRVLNLKLLTIFADKGIHAASLPPSAIARNKNKNLESMDTDVFEHYLRYNVIPVTFGDVIPDHDLGFSIVSGDALAQHLAAATRPKKVIFVTDVDGIFKKDPKQQNGGEPELVDEIDNSRSLNAIQFGSTSVCDVTGGMLNKVKTAIEISKMGIDTQIINGSVRGRLKKALTGEDVVGTIIRGKGTDGDESNGN